MRTRTEPSCDSVPSVRQILALMKKMRRAKHPAESVLNPVRR
jgi:hypothetical protein